MTCIALPPSLCFALCQILQLGLTCTQAFNVFEIFLRELYPSRKLRVPSVSILQIWRGMMKMVCKDLTLEWLATCDL